MAIWLRVLAVTLVGLASAVPHSLRSVTAAAAAPVAAATVESVRPGDRLLAQHAPPVGRPLPSAPPARPAPSGSSRAVLAPAAQAELVRIRTASQRIRQVRLPSPVVLKILKPAPDQSAEVEALGANWKQTRKVGFRWRTAQAGAAGALYQVSLFPFTASVEQWSLPPGLITCGPAGGAAGQPIPPNSHMFFELDLTTFAPLPGMKPSYMLPSPGQGGMTPRLPPGPVSPPPIQKPGPAPHSMLIPGRFPAPGLLLLPVANTATFETNPNVGACALLTQESQKARHNLVTHNPLTYFVRVATVNAQGQLTAPPSPAVTISYYMEDPPQPVKILPAALTVSVDYKAIQWARSGHQYAYRCTRKVDFIAFTCDVGQAIQFHPSSGCSGLDCVGEAIGDTVDSFTSWAEDALNWVSKAYGSIKEAALDLAMKAIPGDCGLCRTALKLGLDYGLTCLGMPPEIPNFDQLVGMGKGYLVAQLTEVASQQTGIPIPSAATGKLVDEVIRRAKEVEDHGTDGSAWFKPDPGFQYADAYLVVHVQNPTAYPRKARLWIVQNDFYWGRDLAIPVLAPSQAVDVPVVLRRRADGQVDELGRAIGKPNTPSSTAGHDWLQRYHAGGATLEVRVTDVGIPELPTTRVAVHMPGCAQLKAANTHEPC